MKYYNLCFVKHHEGDRRAYLYRMPIADDVEVEAGDMLYVRDRRGDHAARACSENFLASECLTKILCDANGGYFPPAEIIGRIEKEAVDVVRTFDGQKILLDAPGIPTYDLDIPF